MANDSFLPIEFRNPFSRASALASGSGFTRNQNAQLPEATPLDQIHFDTGPEVPNQLPPPSFGEMGGDEYDYEHFNPKTDWAPMKKIRIGAEEKSWNDQNKEEKTNKDWEEKNRAGNAKLIQDLENDEERKQLLQDLENGGLMPKPNLIDESKSKSK